MTYCLWSVGGAFIAKAVDHLSLPDYAPAIAADTNQTLLSIMAASMLVIATLAVTSMVSAYSSASSAATPRSFPLIVADDVSQKALSTFLAAFIFSIVALVAVKNSYYAESGHLLLFVLTLLIFAWVIVTFVRWVDAIARLGRLGTAIDKVEAAAADALQQRARWPAFGGLPDSPGIDDEGVAVRSARSGYVQHINLSELQRVAASVDGRVAVRALPGRFVTPQDALVRVLGPGSDDGPSPEDRDASLRGAFLIGGDRIFDDDPRFGLVVLAEIAGKALSPAVNDPGTAIDIIGTLTRLLIDWDCNKPDPDESAAYDRVLVPPLSVDDLFDDAFTAIARDGAHQVEVAVRLQKALTALAGQCGDAVSAAALRHAETALARATQAMTIDADLKAVRAASMAADAAPATRSGDR